jgi:hypothetical protein
MVLGAHPDTRQPPRPPIVRHALRETRRAVLQCRPLPVVVEQIVETRCGVETQQERFDDRARHVGSRGQQRQQLPVRRPVECREIAPSGLDDR